LEGAKIKDEEVYGVLRENMRCLHPVENPGDLLWELFRGTTPIFAN
jgi:hypothetical protein